MTSNSWYKLLKPALILSREYFFLTINLGNRCKTKRLYSLVKNGLRKQKTGTPDVITPRPLNWFGCHRFHTSSTKIYEIQFYYSDLNVVNCYEWKYIQYRFIDFRCNLSVYCRHNSLLSLVCHAFLLEKIWFKAPLLLYFPLNTGCLNLSFNRRFRL